MVLVRVRSHLDHYHQHASLDFESLIEALIFAEDHRFYSHKGIDLRAIWRAIIATTFTGRSQGGSTITQQLVRVITCDYRRSIARKFKELCLAAWLDLHLPKKEQAIIYLHVAYFGWRMNGLRQTMLRMQINLPCSMTEAAAIVARLKYPEPRNPTSRHFIRIQCRQRHIIRLIGEKNAVTSRTSDTV